MNVQTPPEKLTAKDYASDQEVRWCPGCGDYAIVRAMQKTLADLQSAPEKTVFVSGIGCAARFPTTWRPMDFTPSTDARPPSQPG